MIPVAAVGAREWLTDNAAARQARHSSPTDSMTQDHSCPDFHAIEHISAFVESWRQRRILPNRIFEVSGMALATGMSCRYHP